MLNMNSNKVTFCSEAGGCSKEKQWHKEVPHKLLKSLMISTFLSSFLAGMMTKYKCPLFSFAKFTHRTLKHMNKNGLKMPRIIEHDFDQYDDHKRKTKNQ